MLFPECSAAMNDDLPDHFHLHFLTIELSHYRGSTQPYGLIFKPFGTLFRSKSVIALVRLLKANLEGLAAAAKVVAEGGLICFPTDTVYGLGCDPLNASAVGNVTKTKGGRIKAMPVLVKDLEAARVLAYVSDGARKLAEKFWPGPLTMVLRARDILPSILVPENTVGLRSPNHPVCLELLRLCSGHLVGTSANLTGNPPATTADGAMKMFGDSVELVLDGGRSPLGIASSVVDLTGEHLSILREGPIGRKQILRCLKHARAR
jgi:L-threonylcarbamoyladenylate synthase